MLIIIIMSSYPFVFIALFPLICVLFVGYLWDVCGLFVGSNKCNDYKGFIVTNCGQFVRSLWGICDQFVICRFYVVIAILYCAESLYFGYTHKQRRAADVYGFYTQSIYTRSHKSIGGLFCTGNRIQRKHGFKLVQ